MIIQNYLWSKIQRNGVDQSFKKIKNLNREVETFLFEEYLKPTGDNQIVTNLQRYRAKMILQQFQNIVDLLSMLLKLIDKFENSASNEIYKTYVDLIVKHIFERIRYLLKQPLSFFPDLSLWLMAVKGGKGSDPGPFNTDEPVGVSFIFL